MKKVFLSSLFTVLLTWFLSTPAFGSEFQQLEFAAGRNYYNIDGNQVAMDVSPFIENGRFYVPVRHLTTAIGIPEENITWETSTQTVTMGKNDLSITLAAGRNVMYVNGRPIEMDVTPVIRNSRTYLPARYIVENLGGSIEWDAQNQAVIIRPVRPAPAPDNVETGKIESLAKKVLTEQMRIPESAIVLKRFEPVNWPDASLGCPEPGMIYLQVITPGYLLILSDGYRDYEFHADQKGRVVLCSNIAGPVISKTVKVSSPLSQ